MRPVRPEAQSVGMGSATERGCGGRPAGPRVTRQPCRTVDQLVFVGRGSMPRYMVERTFPDGLRIPVTEEGAAACLGVVGRNADLGVTWIHSYVSEDKQTTFCV